MDILEKCLDETINTAADGNADFCLGLEARNDDSRWVQIRWDQLNFAYPLNEPPLSVLSAKGISLPKDVGLEDWQAGRYATFSHGVDPLPELAAFIRSYLKEMLALDIKPGSYALMRHSSFHAKH